MSYRLIVEAIGKIDKEIEGVKHVYDYEPSTPETPCIYNILGAIPSMNQLPSNEEIVYDINKRIVLRYSEAETAEQDLTKIVDAVIETYRSKVKLDGVLSNGSARLIGGRAGYIRVGVIAYRMVEFTLRVTEKTSVTFSD